MSQDLEKFDSLKADVSIFVGPIKSLKVSDFKSSADAIEAGKQIKALMKQVEDKRKELVGPLNERVKLVNSYVKDMVSPLESAESHIRAELNRFAEAQEKIKQEELRRAEDVRREQERKAEEERLRIQSEQEAKRQSDLRELAAAEAAAKEMFGDCGDAAEQVEQARAEIEERNERERLENEARLDREAAIRNAQASATTYDINQNQIKNARKNWKVEIVDIDLVPKEFVIKTLNSAMALASARAGNTNIPGLRFTQEMSVSLGSKTYVPRKVLDR